MLVNKTVEVLVEEEETRPDESCVGQVQLTLGHVGHLKTQQNADSLKKLPNAFFRCKTKGNQKGRDTYF